MHFHPHDTALGDYSTIVSMHLCATRHLLLTYAALSGHGQNVPEVCERINEQLNML